MAPILQVQHLVKFFGRRKVVDGVNFEIHPGEVVGLLGPNGAGKTTSFRMTTGQLPPNDGRVYFNGTDVTELPMYRRARLGMGYLSQEPSIFRRLTVEQNILAVLELLPRSRTLGRSLSRSERNQRTADLLAQFGLTDVRRNNAARCSGGEKRRLEIARCLACEPLMILLDEPFAAVDPKTTEDIRKNIRELASSGIGILLTDHNVREVLKITDRSYLIKDGKVVTHGSPQSLINDPIAINEYLGTTFSDNTFGQPTQALPFTQTPVVTTPGAATQQVLAEERVHRLIELLKHPEQSRAAETQLIAAGAAAVPELLSAMERRDMDMRQRAYHVLQQILGAGIQFDAFATEELRSRQIKSLRDHWMRKAG